MKKCKVCKETINLTIFGMPNDICWGCFQDKQEVLNKNINIKNKEPQNK